MSHSLPLDAAAIIADYIVPGEQLLWAGRPKQGFALRGWDVVHIPLGLLMAIVGTAITFVQIRNSTDSFAICFMLVWTVGAYWAAFGRFFNDARKRARTYYALTNFRVMVISANGSTHVRAMQLITLEKITFTKRSDGTGTIEFNRPSFKSFQYQFETSRGIDPPWFSHDSIRSMAFEMIADARHVHGLIVQARDDTLAREKSATPTTQTAD